MKDKLNDKFKQQFFGQYFWQRVFRFGCPCLNGDPEGQGDIYILNGTTIEQDSETSYLRLRKLESITDEEIYEFLGSMAVDPKPHYLPGARKEIVEEYYDDIYTIDWLRSKGFAIEWMGNTVEQMVEAGWIQLIE